MKTFQLHYIKHPLALATSFGTPLLASFSQDDVEAYAAEYETHMSALRKAQQKSHSLENDLMRLTRQLFDEPDSAKPSKQTKYMLRMFKKGEDLVSQHAGRYPLPTRVARLVKDAVEHMSTYQGQECAPLSDAMIEGNAAQVEFLESQGYECGKDFSENTALAFRRAYDLSNQ